jgi:hypothetical protein
MAAVNFVRDPRDRRYPERLAGSFLASLLIHALLAALLFTVLVSSSQEGATENVQGGQIITVSRLTPVVAANPPAPVHAAPPVPHVTHIAPVQQAPLVAPQAQRLPTNHHELAVQAPTAPPNPRPVPQQTPQPNPQPTQNVFAVQPRNQVPAAPINIPSPAPIAVSTKPPPTTAPSPAPTAPPTVRPSPKPSVVVAAATPSPKPATPAPPVPKASPTIAAVARATASPTVTAAPAPRASAPPAQHPGVPSPSPTSTAAVASTAGTAPSPGPKGAASPGPRPGNGPKRANAPARPVAIRPTPVPERATPAPRARPSNNNLAAKLRSLLPNNPVNPKSKQYTSMPSLNGRLEPTPPPDVLARTKYTYDTKGTGNEERVKMWVTATHKGGPTTICTGWLVRWPEPERGGYADPPSNVPVGQPNGTQIAIGGAGAPHPPLSPFDSGIAPIVEGMVSQPCDGRLLVPFAPSAVPSP